MAELEYYKILGVSTESTEDEIKKAYRALSLKYHPDRNASEEAKTKMLKINEAYETLGDPELKQKYDLNINDRDIGMAMPGEMFSDINNIFNMMFNGNPPPGIRIFHQGGNGKNIFHTQQFSFVNIKPDAIVAEATISMSDSYKGYLLKLEVNRKIQMNNTTNQEVEVLYVNIPPGINSNETIILQDKGNVINNIKGPIHIKIKVNPDSIFIRDGLDLIYNIKITLKDSLCGFTQEFQHLNGNQVILNCITNNIIIKPGFKKVIEKLGMIRDNNVGNLIIVFDVIFPDTLSDIQINNLRQIL